MWLAIVASGLYVVWAYDNRPGAGAAAPAQWPSDSSLTRAANGSTLLFLAHPQCSCTQASLDELAEVLARATRPPRTYVLFLEPSTSEAGWDETALWRRAQALPRVVAMHDQDGVEARRFGVETSGQTLLYDATGALIFTGGITGSRGHAGENAGELALVALLTRGESTRHSSSVFGCPLFAAAE